MRYTNPGNGHAIQPSGGNAIPGRCPRMHWLSVNPALPPPDFRACLDRRQDCCVVSAVADVRRAA
jgi:hypothetical protein